MNNFTHLRLHTEYSLFDSTIKIKELAETLKEHGAKSAAITDNNMFGAIEFYKTMKQNGLKPIIGLEIITCDHKNKKQNICLYAKNKIGYKNLMRLSSMSYVSGVHIDADILRRLRSGILCVFASQNFDAIAANEYKEIFGDDFYLGLLRNNADQSYIKNRIVKFSTKTKTKVVAITDVKYILKEQSDSYEILKKIPKNKSLNRKKHNPIDLYLKTPQEITDIFKDIPEAIASTKEISDKCSLKLELEERKNPNFKFTAQYAKQLGIELIESNKRYSFENDALLFEYISKKGLKERLKLIPVQKHSQYEKRLKIEIDIIKKMNLQGYMLIVWDFINEAKKHEILIGPGSSSTPSSLVAYALNITDIDPIAFNLHFERFLNYECINIPDIDLVIDSDKREDLVNLIIKKYGRYNVAGIISFRKFFSQEAIKIVTKAYGLEHKDINSLIQLICQEPGSALKNTFKKEPKVKKLIDKDKNLAKIWRVALDLEGLNMDICEHISSLVVSNENICNKAPIYPNPSIHKDYYITQYNTKHIENVGLAKFNFLGLKTLSVISRTLKAIKILFGKDIIWSEIDKNDHKVYSTIQNKDTTGIFLFSTQGIRTLAQVTKPNCLEDIISILALHRPVPFEMGAPEYFINRKHGKEKIIYELEELKPILAPTYGLILYKEQIMEIFNTIGGFSMSKADSMLRAIRNTHPQYLEEQRKLFIKGATQNGFDPKKSSNIFDTILKFKNYSFSKSHASAYAYIVFQTAYLKTYFPKEFNESLITMAT